MTRHIYGFWAMYLFATITVNGYTTRGYLVPMPDGAMRFIPEHFGPSPSAPADPETPA